MTMLRKNDMNAFASIRTAGASSVTLSLSVVVVGVNVHIPF